MTRFALPLVLALSACGETQPSPRIPAPPHRVDAPAATNQDAPWPVRIDEGEESVAVYPPHVESRDGDRVTGRSPVEVVRGNARSYGYLFVDARVRADKGGQDTFEDVKYARADFPAARDQSDEWLAFFRDRDPLDGMRVADRIITQDLKPKTALAVKNDPPRIVTTEKPQVLIVVDGAPTLRPLGAVQRVLNSRALVLLDDKSYWALAGDRWFKASSLDATFDPVATDSVPASIVSARGKADEKSYDAMSEMTSKLGSGATLLVTTKPTELLETRGAPTWTKVPDTTLSYVENTDSDIFKDDATKQGYVLLGGRWFSAASQAGPWTYVEPSKLPSDFQKIAADSPRARVRAAIPGTVEAEEAVIASEITNMGAVDRAHAQLAVAFDGSPEFEPVEGTTAPLKYAINTETPVFLADDGAYYALENGVWFTANAANGPWVVATSVPESIDSIPASSPVHYVTYARIYGWDPEWVWVGYTPGYYGAYAYGGVVVWGTGWYYRPWIGHYWYGRPYAYSGYGRWGGPHGYVVAHSNVYSHGGGAVRPTHVAPQHAPPAHVAAQPRVSTANHPVARPQTRVRRAPARPIPRAAPARRR